MEDVVRKLEQVARDEGGVRVVSVRVRLGALSHFTPAHFREHFVDATRGTLAEGAEVIAELDAEATGAGAQGVVVESVEIATG
jgi:hydrogenase nickel incorporation protein HypA/HybF